MRVQSDMSGPEVPELNSAILLVVGLISAAALHWLKRLLQMRAIPTLSPRSAGGRAKNSNIQQNDQR